MWRKFLWKFQLSTIKDNSIIHKTRGGGGGGRGREEEGKGKRCFKVLGYKSYNACVKALGHTYEV